MIAKTVEVGSLRRRGLRGTALGAAVVAAVLTITACQPSGGEDHATPAPATSSGAPSGSASTGGSASKTTAPTGDSGTGGSSPTAAGKGDGGETGGGNGTPYADCKATGLRTAVELQDGRGETPRHFLLTVTNTTKKPCALNDAPLVRLTDDNSDPIVEALGEPDTEPVVVQPGGKAYAGLYVFGNDEGGEATYDRSDGFTATLVAGEGTELSGTLAFELPRGLDTVSVDDAARVNGWAGTEGLAMRPINQL
ncbi:DUF4232 domain-containing protein [Streptomyces sp. NPDC053493]|uniref:DUF4232 domain-containing protein n=1 Tax=Streptomyces sp. NPDC053493 TaxID=3365705 RepID=UPI0037D13AD9